MIRACIFLVSSLGALAVSPAARAAEPAVQPLFDGASLAGWQGNAAHWRIDGGAITGEIPSGAALDRNEWIFWDGRVADFDLTLEYRITGGPTANSGIQFRCERRADGSAAGYQADLDDGKEWLGRIYDEHGRALIMERGTHVSIAPDGRRWIDTFARPADFTAIAKPGEWNTYRVRAVGPHAMIWINGKLFGTLDDHEKGAADLVGKLAFQLHAGPGPARVQFRNISLVPLGETAPVRERPASGAVNTSFPALDAAGKALNLDFEKGTLEDWTAQGNAWEGQPIKGDTVTPRKPGQASRHAGRFWLGGYEPKRTDDGTGTLTSAPFVVNRPWASFLVGAGGDVAAIRVEIVDADGGKVFHTATGKGEEDMHREVVDMRPLAGRKAFLRLVDAGKRGWDHLNFDDFRFHDEPPSLEGGPNGRLSQSPVLWHLQPNPASTAPNANAEAAAVVRGMSVVDGFKVDLIAAEPDVRQPIAFCFDERGRIWILEAFSYPNRQPEGAGKDRIVILADEDGDGTFEKRTVFAEGINLGSGIEVGFGGVYIGAAPQLLFYADKNHDDRADGPPEVLLDGWGYQDTHETLNSFTWGPDGWLYGNQGVFTKSSVGRPGTSDAGRVAVRAGVWRFHPVNHRFEVFSTGGSNQWGLDYDARGRFFMTHCRSFFGGGGTTYAIRNAHFWNQANANYAPFISPTAPDFAPALKNYLPASAKYDSGEGGAGKPGTTAVYGGHSHVGTMIYQADNWPSSYRGHLFTHNLHGHQMNHQTLEADGSGWEAMHGGFDMLYAPDPRYIAVDLQTGPDGAVYSIDWCDQQHCHTPIEEKWDRSNGRVYRMEWAATYKPVKVDLASMSDVDLARLQAHPNAWHGRTARRLLQERAASGALSTQAVEALKDTATAGDASLALCGLWALEQTNRLDDVTLEQAAAHPDADVRAWAVQLATPHGGKPRLTVEKLVAMAKGDPSPRVRLALASALPALPDEGGWSVAGALALHGEDAGDRFLPKLLWSGVALLEERSVERALDLADATPLAELADSIRWFAAKSAAGREALASRKSFTPAQAERAVRLASFALQGEATLPMPAGWPAAQKRLEASSDPAVRADVEQLAAVFGDRDVLVRLRATLADPAQSLSARKSAFATLKRTGDPEALPVFASLLGDPAFRAAVIPSLARSSDPAVAGKLLTVMPTLKPAEKVAALEALTGNVPFATALVSALENGSFPKTQLTSLHVRQMKNLGNAPLMARLEKIWGKFNESPESARATIAHWRKVFGEAPLWAYDAGAGRAVFDRVCATCHTLGATERKLGPDLAGSAKNGIDYFLENIVDPNAVVGDDFQLVIVTKKDGSVVSGSVTGETDSAVTLRSVAEAVTVPKSDIRSREKLPQSLMPPGLLESMPERDAIALLKFLTTADGR